MIDKSGEPQGSNDDIRCLLDPEHDGRYKVWIEEVPYRGIDTDGALRNWNRVRVGEAWTSAHLVGSYRTRRGSIFAAWRALRKARRNRRRNDVRRAKRRANLDRERIYVR